ncbi:hypothetical protein F2Q68_00039816 [Brassica cretica]|uniref:Uncharacterized protein n=1 Tax=Brassica cretica TaxID=69181 RepID=A0A8S9MDF3_BRACR|nr:hypothetical protein F2Q68_00039816 [Brassica cretica]
MLDSNQTSHISQKPIADFKIGMESGRNCNGIPLRRAIFSRKERKPATQAGALSEGVDSGAWEEASATSASELFLSFWEEYNLRAKSEKRS